MWLWAGQVQEVRSQSQISGLSLGDPGSGSFAYECVPLWGDEGDGSDDREERKLMHLRPDGSVLCFLTVAW